MTLHKHPQFVNVFGQLLLVPAGAKFRYLVFLLFSQDLEGHSVAEVVHDAPTASQVEIPVEAIDPLYAVFLVEVLTSLLQVLDDFAAELIGSRKVLHSRILVPNQSVFPSSRLVPVLMYEDTAFLHMQSAAER